MLILDKEISRSELSGIAESLYGDMVKGVVDVERGILAIDAELHSDLESLLYCLRAPVRNHYGA